MNALRILAVDDEPLALRRIELLLRRIADVELVGTAGSGEEAIAMIASLRPDLVLLDVRMAGIDCFGVVDVVAGADAPQIVFVTAFDNFAARAFGVSATDYVVKPVEFHRLAAAVEKARRVRAMEGAGARIAELRATVAALKQHQDANAPPQDIWAEKRGEFVRIPVDGIDWIEAERDYVFLHANGEPYLLRATMGGIHERLGADRFVRIRRSALVRRDRIAAVRRAGYGDMRLQMASGVELRVGRTYVKRVRELIASRPN